MNTVIELKETDSCHIKINVKTVSIIVIITKKFNLLSATSIHKIIEINVLHSGIRGQRFN